MARETKVGVLTGLAFIVCFAIILANRGRQPPSPTHPAVAQRSLAPPSGNTVADSRAAGSRMVPAPVTPNTTSLTRVDRPESRPTQPTAQPVVRPPTSGASLVDAAAGAAGDAPASGASIPASTVAQLAEMVGRAAHDAVGAPDTAATLQASAGSETRHTVAPGETLSRIALAHYGRKSPRLVEAIYEANRGVLASPDAVKVGVELVLPRLKDRNDQVATDGPTRPEKDGASGAATLAKAPDAVRTVEAGTRFYQVRKNDRLVSIAREQLGSESRWKEIFELNKDKFPDPSRIREGVKIKLPADGRPRG